MNFVKASVAANRKEGDCYQYQRLRHQGRLTLYFLGVAHMADIKGP
jgi:hypothetical protein